MTPCCTKVVVRCNVGVRLICSFLVLLLSGWDMGGSKLMAASVTSTFQTMQSNRYKARGFVQTTRGVDSINFRILSAFFQFVLLYAMCAVCYLGFEMRVILCVKEADLSLMAFVAYLPLGFENSTPCLNACTTHGATRKQHPCPATRGVGSVNFWSFAFGWP